MAKKTPAKSTLRHGRTVVALSLATGVAAALLVLEMKTVSTPATLPATSATPARTDGPIAHQFRDVLLAKQIKKAKQASELAPFDKPHEAMEYFLDGRTDGKYIDYSLYERAMDHIKSTNISRTVGDVISWTPVGPGNIGGRTRAILIDPGDPLRMFAAGIAGGVWRTTNGGASWEATSDLLDTIAVSTLAFQQQGTASVNTNVIYAGTGEAFFNIDAVRGAGILKTTDGGNTWVRLPSTNTTDFQIISKIVASPNDPQRIYAATRTGLWRTTNGGTSWSSVFPSTAGGGISDIEIRTDQNPDELLIMNGISTSNSARGVYRSVNGGDTWTPSATLGTATAPDMGRVDIAIAPSNQAIAYALVSDRNNGDRVLDVYRSLDGGQTWASRLTVNAPTSFTQTSTKWLLLSNPVIANLVPCGFGSSNSMSSQGWYDNIIAVSPTDPDVVFAGGIDICRSDDGGANWGVISYWWVNGFPGYSHADQHGLTFHPQWNGTSNQTLFSASDGGVNVTNNALAAPGSGSVEGICYDSAGSVPTAVDWTSLNNGYEVTQFYHGRAYPTGTDSYMGGTQDNGTLRGTDIAGINAWTSLQGGDGGYVEINNANPNIIFAEFTRKSMTRSTNGGTFFLSASTTLPDATTYQFIHPFRLDPSDPEIMWYGGRQPWRTTNASSAPDDLFNGIADINWTQAGSSITGQTIASWAIHPANSNHVMFGTTQGNIFRNTSALSGTSGTAWTQQTSGLPNGGSTGYMSWVEYDQNDSTGNTVYATQSRFGLGHVYRSTNGGSTWTNITGDLPDIPAHTIRVQPGFANILWVGTDLGVFRSTNGGTNWIQVNSPGFANAVVEALEFQDDHTLYAFTHGRSVFRSRISGTSVNDWQSH